MSGPGLLQCHASHPSRSFFSLAVRADGTVVSWGESLRDGQFTTPPGLSNVVAISAGDDHAAALLDSAPAPRQVQLSHLSRTAAGFCLDIPTQCGRVYALEYKTSLNDPAWTALPLVAGNGTRRTLVDPSPASAARFYRVRAW